MRLSNSVAPSISLHGYVKAIVGRRPMSKLIDRYVRMAEEWGEAMRDGDSTQANFLYHELEAEFAKFGGAEIDFLFARADCESDSVRFFVASHVRKLDIRRAQAMYEQLVRSQLPFIALSSRYILKEIVAELTQT